MHSCGMYNYSGQFSLEVGLPAKSGVSGTLILVIPNVMGIGLWSPALDSVGNTVRGVQFAKVKAQIEQRNVCNCTYRAPLLFVCWVLWGLVLLKQVVTVRRQKLTQSSTQTKGDQGTGLGWRVFSVCKNLLPAVAWVRLSARDRAQGPRRAEQERDDYSSFSAGGREGDEVPRE